LVEAIDVEVVYITDVNEVDLVVKTVAVVVTVGVVA
jgi:hypothetical protein